MHTKVYKVYAVPLLLSFAVFVVLLALRVEREPLTIALLFLGANLGTFVLDLDYIIHAYFTEPDTDFSKTLKGYIKHFDLAGALNYINYHKREIKEKTLNSALFQVVIGGLMLFVLAAPTSIFLKTLLVSTFINSLYRMAEEYFEHDIKEWFWAIDVNLGRKTLAVYTAIMLSILLYGLTLF